MCRKFSTINAIALSEISNASFIHSTNKKTKKLPAPLWRWRHIVENDFKRLKRQQIKEHGPTSDTKGLIYVI